MQGVVVRKEVSQLNKYWGHKKEKLEVVSASSFREAAMKRVIEKEVR